MNDLKIPYDDDLIAETSWSAIALSLALILAFFVGITTGMILAIEGIRRR